MAIGVFDSGVGGLTIHRGISDAFPDANLIYYADQKNAPYGSLDGQRVVELTQMGCEVLFNRGASLVVLACNTASAVALRSLQQNWLPDYQKTLNRPVNILGIIVPTIEEATGQIWRQHADRLSPRPKNMHTIAVFATRGTVASRVYEIEIDKHRQDIAAFSEPCPNLAQMIEDDAPAADMKALIEGHVENVTRRIGRSPDEAILGCTHYQIVADLFTQALPAGTPLIHQPTAVANALIRYTTHHPEYDIGNNGRRDFYTSGTGGAANSLVKTFWGEDVTLESIATQTA